MKFDWDDSNTNHIHRHGITPREAEQVIENNPLVVQYQQRGGEERWLVLGQTDKGRLLVVVYTERQEAIRVVTAYLMTKRLEELYFKER